MRMFLFVFFSFFLWARRRGDLANQNDSCDLLLALTLSPPLLFSSPPPLLLSSLVALQIAALFLEEVRDQKTTLVYVMDKSGNEEPVWLKNRKVNGGVRV
jgi:hypothetical protein